MLKFFQNLDRRWIFLLMLLSVAIPILGQWRFPEKATPLVQDVFDVVDNLPPGSKVLMAFDFDPASEGELGPMATAFTRHCCEKQHKMYFFALWPVGPQMIESTIARVIRADYPDLEYGEDYVNLGFMSGNEGVIKVIVTDLKKLITTDVNGTNIDNIPMCRNLQNVQDFDLIINVSAGYPGTKEWVQYAATPYAEKFDLVAGCTGVQAPLLYPYIPEQLPGLLGAIKGASEYEDLVLKAYPIEDDGTYTEGLRRMGPQLAAHVLMVLLIVLGNVIFFAQRRQERKVR